MRNSIIRCQKQKVLNRNNKVTKPLGYLFFALFFVILLTTSLCYKEKISNSNTAVFSFETSENKVISSADSAVFSFETSENKVISSADSATILSKKQESDRVHIVFECQEQKYEYNLNESVKSVRKKIKDSLKVGFSYSLACKHSLDGVEEVIDTIKKRYNKSQVNSSLQFNTKSKEIFTYYPHSVGQKIDEESLWTLVALKIQDSGDFSVKVPITKIQPEITIERLKEITVLRSSFSTYCTDSPKDRQHNIMLALSYLDGSIIKSGEMLSFNKKVGIRSAQRGFRMSPVIVNGDYQMDYGGGVCQVSTTLYNSCLIAGLDIVERHRHTLRSNYVFPSFDAMVSDGSADLVIKNNTNENIYLLCEYVSGRVTIKIFGEKNAYEINRRSQILSESKAKIDYIIDNNYKYAHLLKGKDQYVLLPPINAVYSQAILDYYQNGQLVKSQVLHKDYYYARKGIIVKAPNNLE